MDTAREVEGRVGGRDRQWTLREVGGRKEIESGH